MTQKSALIALIFFISASAARINPMEQIATTVPTQLENYLHQLSTRSCEKINLLMRKLKKAETFKKPDWPVVLFQRNDLLAKELAIQIGHELGRLPIVLTHEHVSHKSKIKELKIASHEQYQARLYIIDNLNDFYDSFKNSYRQMVPDHSERLLEKLLLMLAEFNPLIIIESKSESLPASIRALFLYPWHNFPKIITLHFSGNYLKQLLVSNWCKQHNIDCLYSISSLQLPPGLYNGAINQEITNPEEISQVIVSTLKKNNALEYKDYQNILDQLPIESINLEPIIPNNPKVAPTTVIRLIKNNNNSQSISYKAAINLDNLNKILSQNQNH